MKKQKVISAILSREPEKNMEDILGYAVHTITLKPVSANFVSLIQGAAGCSVQGEVQSNQREKKKAASVKHVNFLKSSNLKGNTSASSGKKRFLRENMFIRIYVRIFKQAPEQLEFVYWVSRNNSIR